MKAQIKIKVLSCMMAGIIVPLLLTGQTEFNLTIERNRIDDGLIFGTISVNSVQIGNCFENEFYQIPAGSYKGLIRYNSGKGFVQNPFGGLGNKGDFLLEVSGVPGRTDILFHAGFRPWQSKGCILMGPVDRDIDSSAYLDEDHPLYKLRLIFYGTEEPVSCPDKSITIDIIDNY